MNRFRVAGAQLNLRVGDIEGNVERIRDAMSWAEARDADMLLLPELAVTGYPPEDLLLRPGFVSANVAALEELARSAAATASVVGFVDRTRPEARSDDAVARTLANAAGILANGAVVGVYRKQLLPNYGVFDEARYFAPGPDPAAVWTIGSLRVGVSICEDIWSPDGPPSLQAAAGADLLVNINGSPFHVGKGAERRKLLATEAARSGVPLVYLNLVGGQDELVFDGDSMVFDEAGELVYRAAQFAEELFVVDLEVPGATEAVVRSPVHVPEIAPRLEGPAEVYAALVCGLRDYVAKNGFSEVVIGLSGGIDSALTCALAVDALGPDAVWGVSMPSRYSSQGSIDDSADLAGRLGCRFDVIGIDEVFGGYLSALAPAFAGTEHGIAEENLQARIRGAILMALSNKFGGMVVATGNKSEMAVGYATLYGDMAGGFAVLKDVLKTTVYELARWRNREDEVIPAAIIDKEPSAELRPDQRDSDSLPGYDVLDAILERYVENDASIDAIVAAGFAPDVVRGVARMVDRNEYKRRQAAPGVRITQKGFGKDRRLPITNGYRD